MFVLNQRIKNFSLFGSISLVSLYICAVAGFSLIGIVSLNASMAYGLLAMAFAFRKSNVFFKGVSGKLKWYSYVLFWPHYVMNYLTLDTYRNHEKYHAFDEVIPGLYLGVRLWESDQNQIKALGINSFLDVTSEYSKLKFIRSDQSYLCVPLLNDIAPTFDELDKCVTWIKEQSKNGHQYVHCDLGLGRGPMVVAAFLIKEGGKPNAQEALEWVQKQRKQVGLTKEQYLTLVDYSKYIHKSVHAETINK